MCELADVPPDLAPALRLTTRDLGAVAATCRRLNCWARSVWKSRGARVDAARLAECPEVFARAVSLDVRVRSTEHLDIDYDFEARELRLEFASRGSPPEFGSIAAFVSRFSRLRSLVLTTAGRLWYCPGPMALPRKAPMLLRSEVVGSSGMWADAEVVVFRDAYLPTSSRAAAVVAVWDRARVPPLPRAPFRDFERLVDLALEMRAPDPLRIVAELPPGLARLALTLAEADDDLHWDAPLLAHCRALRELRLTMRDNPRGFERIVPTVWGTVGTCRVFIELERDFGEDAWAQLLEAAADGEDLEEDTPDVLEAARRTMALAHFSRQIEDDDDGRLHCTFSNQ